MDRLSRLWYYCIHRLCTALAFSRVAVVRRERLPRAGAGPVLYLSLHRNGAVDGFVLGRVFPRCVFLVARQLRANRFLRLFFCGIEVLRRKDAGGGGSRRAIVRRAFDRCEAVLDGHGELVIFPEGTSTLGPRHLPFESGAARILQRFISRHPGEAVTVVPLGLHYERAWAWRSRMEVVVGEPIRVELGSDPAARETLADLKQRLAAGLEGVGAEFATAADQEAAEALAYAATLGTERSYALTLLALARDLPRPLAERWREADGEATRHGLRRHQGVPLVPRRRIHLPLYAAWLAVIAPLVGAAALLNAPPLLATAVLTRRLADDRNVVMLVRILAGLAVGTPWVVLASVAALLVAGWGGVAIYLGVSLAGFASYYRFKKLAVLVHNGVRAPAALRARLLRLHESNLNQANHAHHHHHPPSAPVLHC